MKQQPNAADLAVVQVKLKSSRQEAQSEISVLLQLILLSELCVWLLPTS